MSDIRLNLTVYMARTHFGDWGASYWYNRPVLEAIDTINDRRPQLTIRPKARTGLGLGIEVKAKGSQGIDPIHRADATIEGKIVAGTRFSYAGLAKQECVSIVVDAGIFIAIEVALPPNEHKVPFRYGDFIRFQALLLGHTYFDWPYFDNPVQGTVDAVDYLGEELGAFVRLKNMRDSTYRVQLPDPGRITEDLFLSESNPEFLMAGSKIPGIFFVNGQVHIKKVT